MHVMNVFFVVLNVNNQIEYFFFYEYKRERYLTRHRLP